jgi:gliding motility-associated-like protein
VLVVVNDSGCVDTARLNIEVRDYHTFYIPNAFTPNGDNVNDTWAPVHINILSRDFQLTVFDRWGARIFETTDIKEMWNGRWRNGGDLVQQDVYVYRVIYYDNFDQKHEEIGSVSVIR